MSKSHEEKRGAVADQVSPLILAADMFPALEDAVLVARNEVLLSFRLFDPMTATRSPKTLDRGLKNWQDLLALKAKEGLAIRVFLTDFEPIMTPELHAEAWRNAAAVLEVANEVPSANLQVLCAQHEARFSRAAEWLFWPLFLQKLWKAKAKLASGALDLTHLPGIRRYLKQDGQFQWKQLAAPAAMHPVTHHQKFAVIDSDVAIIGGLDVDERRYDDRGRNRDAHETWQDLSLKIVGPTAAALRERFLEWWNNDCARSQPLENLAWVAGQNAVKLRLPEPIPADNAVKTPVSKSPYDVVATRAAHQSGFFVLRPKLVESSVLKTTLQMIGEAKTCIYIETQFLRHQPIADALAKTGEENPELNCIIVLPFAPEEVAFSKQRNGAHRLGEHLQVKCLDQIQSAFGPRCGVFGLIKREQAKDETGRAKAYGSGVIHVHSKVLLIDDAFCTVTSANLNGRSMVWDTELGVAARDADLTQALRLQLWTMHSASRSFGEQPLKDAVAAWKDLALKNTQAAPPERQGFIAPYKKMPARRFGAPTFYIPKDMV